MKKSLLSVFALATMLLATGCSQEDELVNGGENGELVEVSFNIKTGEEAASRAISDGKKAKQLYWTVFNQNGDVIPQDNWTKTMTEDPTIGTTVKFTLVKGQTYDFVFWAQTEGTNYYNITERNLKEITVNYNSNANDEGRDAFFGNELNYKVEGGNFTSTVKLKRPFGQLNVGTTEEDYQKATTLLLDKPVNHSKLVVKNLPNKLNLLTGEVSGNEAEAVFNLAELPKDTDTQGDYAILEVETDATKDGKEKYVHLSMNYLLASTESAIKNVSILLANGDDEADEVNTIAVPNAPIQRNYRTNIVGRLLTADGEFTIIVDPVYTGEHTSVDGGEFQTSSISLNDVYYNDIASALAAAVDGDVIKIGTGEYTLPQNINLKNNAQGTITFEGVGENTVINIPKNQWNNNALPGCYATNLDLKFENLTIKTNNDWMTGGFGVAKTVAFDECTIIGGYHVNSWAPHTFTNCTIDPLNDYIYTYSADCVFEGCTFTSSEGKALQVYSELNNAELKVTIKDCTFTAAKVAHTSSTPAKPVSAIDINSIQGNKFIVNISNTTATGYGVGQFSNSSLWNIKGGAENVTLTIDGVDYIVSNESLKNVLTQDKEVIEAVMAVDLTYDVAAWATNGMGTANTKSVTINGNGKNLTFNLTNSDWNNVATNGAKLTINDAKINITGNESSSAAWNTHALGFNCELELNNVTVSRGISLEADSKLNNVTINETIGSFYTVWVPANGQTISIDGLTVDTEKGRGIKVADQYCGESINGDSNGRFGKDAKLVNLEIKNSTFKTADKAAVLVSSIAGAHVIWGKNNDITGVKKDTYNAVWVDEDWADYYDLTTVNGCTMVLEGEIAEGVTKEDENTFVISKAAGMFWFANQVNVAGKTFSGQTVKLGADIDLKNQDWIPVGQTGGYSSATYFQGTLDGNNKTIKNLNITHWEEGTNGLGKNYASGLLGFIDGGGSDIVVKNLTVDGATVKGHHWVGTIVGYLTGKVEGCKVLNAAVECTHKNDEACGDKAGAVVGYINGTQGSISDCHAGYSTVKAGRDGGQVVGASKESQVSGCTATSVTVSATDDCTDSSAGNNIRNEVIGRLL